MKTNSTITVATAACLAQLALAPIQAQATTTPALTPVYCQFDGSSGLPAGAIDRFVNILGRGLCLDFGESSQDTSSHLTLIGARFDNVSGLPVNNISFRVHNYNSSLANRLLLYLYFLTPSGSKVYAYAYASAPSQRTFLPNGDVVLSFNQPAFTTIPSGISLAGGKISALQIGTIDADYYTPATYIIYSATVNGAAVTANTASGAPFPDCTF